jgi:hypothetical protein
MAAETVRAFIMSFFLAHGYQPYQAEALVRQAWVESRFEHCIISRSRSAYLFQWVGSRKAALHHFSGSSGCPSLTDQLRFADHELQSAPYSRFWQQSPATVFGFLRRCFGAGRC